jgi:O-antigen ligase
MVWAVAHTPRGLFDYAAPWLLLVSILLCDVRTAAVVAAVLITFTARHLPAAPWIKAALAALFGLASAVLVWFFVGNRFLDSGDQGLGRFFGEGSILACIGTTNRAEAWAHLFQQLPSGINWFGQGPGLSSFLVDELLAIHHPHNEYLRIFFDFGWVGLTLFLAGNLVLWIALVGLHRKKADDGVFASILLLPALALLAVTDNPFVFAYVMLPAALILSLSLAKEINPQSRAQTALVANPHR